MLSLAVVYNDLKDLLWVYYYSGRARPNKNELITRYLGEHCGFRNHASKLLLSTFNELVELIEMNQTVLTNELFKKCVNQLPKTARFCWDALVSVAIGKEIEHKFMRSVFYAARNKVSFHYKDLKAINFGYRLRFTDQIRKLADKKPYVSLGSSAIESRFYFADALVQSYINNVIGEETLTDFGKQLSELTEQINFALRFLVEHFVYARKGAFRDEAEIFS